MRLTRRYHFPASHRLHNPALSDEENRDLYGKCNNPYGHGHNYMLEVTVEGRPDETTGCLIVLDDLDALVREQVLNVYKGKNMNLDIDTFADGRVPTTENVAMDIRARLQKGWPPAGERFGHTRRMPALGGVRLHETLKNIFDIR